jgi:2'-5' RNA ligase
MAAIQSIRAPHDPQFALLAPHLTLLFPIDASQSTVVDEARSAARDRAAFPFALHSVQAVRDRFGPGGHVFLVAGNGAAEIAALHAQLYSGVFRPAHRADIPYVPHITVAAHADFAQCAAIAARLAVDRRDIKGAIEALTVVEVAGTVVTTIATVALPPRTA